MRNAISDRFSCCDSMLAQHLHEDSLKGMAFALTDVLASTA